MKNILTAAALAVATAALAQAPDQKSAAGAPARAQADADAQRRSAAEIAELRRQVEALTKRVESLSRTVAQLASQSVSAVRLDTVTDFFTTEGNGLEPKVIGRYSGKLVAAQVTLVGTERAQGGGSYPIGRTVLITSGGSAAVAVEGADVLCNWVIYDEANTIKVRNENCNHMWRGLRGHFTGAAYLQAP